MKKKLLALFYRPPLLGYSQNSQGQFYILLNIQKFFEVKILSFNSTINHNQNKKYFKTNNSIYSKIFNLLIHQTPPRLTHLLNESFFDEFKTIVHEFKPDIIYVDHILMMQYILKFRTNSKIWLYNEECQLYIKNQNLRRDLVELIKNFRLSEYEKKVIKIADRNFTITTEECNYLKSIGFDNVKTLPYPVDNLFYYYGWKYKQKDFSLLFVGDFSHQPNREAVKLICSKIYPAIRNLRIKITLVGRNIKKIKKYLNSEIDSYENVEDVRPYYWGSTLFIAPIFSGSGMRIKILEAASCGIPILMTHLANLGVNFENNKEAFISNNIREMITLIINIYQNENIDLEKISLNANKKVKLKFSIESLSKYYDTIFMES